ncbi:hypothetical protein BJN34_21740 [Cupriavidus necator]|uniref:Uncharacterized protein n=2 Tax=Cupriavidus necator TaxID=106590 RepID=A0A1U9UUX6_CUPNE|nr:hypothetical protein BJN34_21740 [Cupriavidus necator]
MPLYLVQPPAETEATQPPAAPRDISFEWLAPAGNAHVAADALVAEATAQQAGHLADQAALEIVLVAHQGPGWGLSWL